MTDPQQTNPDRCLGLGKVLVPVNVPLPGIIGGRWEQREQDCPGCEDCRTPSEPERWPDGHQVGCATQHGGDCDCTPSPQPVDPDRERWDESPGDVIAAKPDGTIILDDGITTYNPRRAREFLAAQEADLDGPDGDPIVEARIQAQRAAPDQAVEAQDEPWTITRWRCPNCGETERTGPLVNHPDFEDGDFGHCAACKGDYPAPDPIKVVPTSLIDSLRSRAEAQRQMVRACCDAALARAEKADQVVEAQNEGWTIWRAKSDGVCYVHRPAGGNDAEWERIEVVPASLAITLRQERDRAELLRKITTDNRTMYMRRAEKAEQERDEMRSRWLEADRDARKAEQALAERTRERDEAKAHAKSIWDRKQDEIEAYARVNSTQKHRIREVEAQRDSYREENERLREALGRIARGDYESSEEGLPKYDAGLGGHPCGCYYDSGPYAVYCEQHGPEAVAAQVLTPQTKGEQE